MCVIYTLIALKHVSDAYKMINQGKVAYSLVNFHVEMEAYKQQGCAQELLSAGRSVLRDLGEESQGRTAKFQNTPNE